jgi:hypothetical protein
MDALKCEAEQVNSETANVNTAGELVSLSRDRLWMCEGRARDDMSDALLDG